MNIDAQQMPFERLNQLVRESACQEIVIDHCLGQRYIGGGLNGCRITINGTPGNALGAYLNGAEITVRGNVQDAAGDTMNDGVIVIHGSAGDATGYAMRGGRIYVRGNTGYRAGIHMKSYQDKTPVLVVGGCAGSFLGEYQAGGTIVVLGLGRQTGEPLVGYFCGTGMHGGKIFLRCEEPPCDLPAQVMANLAGEEDLAEIDGYLQEFCQVFGQDYPALRRQSYYVLRPNTKNPYRRLYTPN
ncbi:MAG: glutamate synthase [Clostridiales bacterium]|nr:glutamate synthase [Clostridiales bacterium]